LTTMLLELIEGRHDDCFAERTKVLCHWERAMDMRDVTVEALNFVENFVALLALDFADRTLVRTVGFSAGIFLKFH
jgi:hypothetical protein